MEYPKTTGESYSKTVTNGFLQVGAQQGWQCPVCKRILSPWTQECPCKGMGEGSTVTLSTDIPNELTKTDTTAYFSTTTLHNCECTDAKHGRHFKPDNSDGVEE